MWRWLDERLGRMNLTYDWQATRFVSLVYDFDAHRLGGVPLRGPLHGLSSLGPSDNKRERDPAVLSYRAHGIDLIRSGDDELLEGVVFGFGDLRLGSFAGTFRRAGRTFGLSRESREETIERELGVAEFRELEPSGAVVLYYEWPGDVEAQFAFEHGALASLEVSIYPELPSLRERSRSAG
jgi:hypothetical protein